MERPDPVDHNDFVMNDDTILDIRIGMLLKIGMLTSAAVILLGGVLFLLHHGDSKPNYTVFRGVPDHLNTLAGIAVGVRHGDDLAIVQLGMLLLIATPVARVVFSIFAFLSERDYLYVTISTIVLAVLLYSLIWH